MNPKLTLEKLQEAAQKFCETESVFPNQDLFGVTDGKAVGTIIEHKFQKFLEKNYSYNKGSSAKGIDLPDPHINTDIKVTSIKQPQSSCPFKMRNKRYSDWDTTYLFLFTTKQMTAKKK